MIPLTQGTWRSRTHRRQKGADGCQGLEGERDGESEYNGYRASVGKDEKVPEKDGSDACNMRMYLLLNCTLQNG